MENKAREPLVGYMVIDDYVEDYSSWDGHITYPDPTGANLHWLEPIKMIEYSALEQANLKIQELETQLEFAKQYLNPADTSFRQMIDSFRSLSKENQEKLIDLSKALLALKVSEK